MEIFKLFGSILIKSDEADKSIRKTESKAGKLANVLGNGIKTAAKWGAALVAGATAAVGGMTAIANKSAEAADRVDKMSQKIGLSKEAFQEWDYAMGQSGVDIGVMQTGVKSLTSLMDRAREGSESAVDVFDKLGLSIYDGTGALKSQEDMMRETIMTLADMEDSTERARLATEIFGKAGTELAPLLNSGSAGIEDLMNRAHELGLVMSDEAVTAGVVFGDTMADVENSLGMVATKIGIEFMPIIQAILDWVLAHMPEIQEVVGKAIGFVKDVVAAFTKFWQKHGEKIAGTLKAVMDALMPIVKPVLSALKGVFDLFISILEGDWESAWNSVVDIVKNIGRALFEAGKAIFNALFDGIKSVWQGITSWIQEKVDWLASKLFFWRSAKDEMGGGDSDGSHASGLPYVPYDGYRAILHKGETVVNAAGSQSMVEDIVNGLAGVINGGRSGQPVVVKVYLDKREIAEGIFDPLNDVSRQRGEPLGAH